MLSIVIPPFRRHHRVGRRDPTGQEQHRSRHSPLAVAPAGRRIELGLSLCGRYLSLPKSLTMQAETLKQLQGQTGYDVTA